MRISSLGLFLWVKWMLRGEAFNLNLSNFDYIGLLFSGDCVGEVYIMEVDGVFLN